MSGHSRIEPVLTPLFIQARQEALKESARLEPQGGIVTSSPSKVSHLVEQAEGQLIGYLVESFRQALQAAHHDDWDMETVSEAAHICANTFVNQGDKS